MSEKRMVYAEDVIQRIRDLAPEILGGWYNPDMENELEQLVCVVENTPTAAAQDTQRWRKTAENPPTEADANKFGMVLAVATGYIGTRYHKMWKHGLLILSHYFQKTSRFGCRFRSYRGRLKSE